MFFLLLLARCFFCLLKNCEWKKKWKQTTMKIKKMREKKSREENYVFFFIFTIKKVYLHIFLCCSFAVSWFFFNLVKGKLEKITRDFNLWAYFVVVSGVVGCCLTNWFGVVNLSILLNATVWIFSNVISLTVLWFISQDMHGYAKKVQLASYNAIVLQSKEGFKCVWKL